MKGFFWSVCLLSASVLASCDDHDPLDNGIHVGYVVCRDHSVMSLEAFESSGRSDASGVVFAEQDGTHPTLAISLSEVGNWSAHWQMLESGRNVTHYKSMSEKIVDDETGETYTRTWEEPYTEWVEQAYLNMGTSCSLTAFDGFANTVSLYETGVCPPATEVYSSHISANQADYIPSVAEMRLLVSRRDVLNEVLSRIEATGCSVMYLQAKDDWYWTSTEVESDPVNLMWVCSMENGGIMPALKKNSYMVRPIFQLDY